MIISHNTTAMNVNRITNENISLHGKSTRKVSSGYRINCGADDPAGLGLSEIMRRQIRGLMQATNNTKDGVAFVQTADGAMDEIHSMLQRMNELTVKALQGTYSDSDRMALNVEFDQLRTEIDRINHTTEFGTDFPVFEEHEPSYYKICGNRKWDDNQLHTISPMANALKIHLPDSYEPKDYTITVPAGVYTTQELVDEIDDALSSMVPPNPGFVFELTSDGYCNLSFEKADGTPTKIDFVDGSLAYLIYDFQGGMGSNDILGTTIFEVNRGLMIFEGKNDEFGFYLEGVGGGQPITVTIPAGSHTREDLIDIINAKLPTELGVVAVPYGDHCIQITSGSDAAITGLHGNMFKYEDTKPVYSSVFYDNVKYGSCYKSSAGITGRYYPSDYAIEISDANNKLKITLNDPPKEVEITFTKGHRTISSLAAELNDQLKDLGAKAEGENALSIYSTIAGEHSILEFDMSKPVYANTYKTLFLSTYKEPSTENGNLAAVVGIPDLSGNITFERDDVLAFTLNDEKEPYTISIPKDINTLDDLISHLNSNLGENLKGKIVFAADSLSSPRHLVIMACNGDVKSINMLGTNASKILITTKLPVPDGVFVSGAGKKETIQGTNIINCFPKKITVTSSPWKDEPITITDNSNTLTFEIIRDNISTPYTITLAPDEPGPYSIPELIGKINKELQSSDDQYLKHVEISYDKGLQVTLNLEHNDIPDGNWKINIPFDPMTDALNNTIWKAVFKTEEKDVYNRQDQKPATLTTEPLGTDIVIDQTNCSLDLSINGISVTVSIDTGTYKSVNDLKTALQDALLGSALDGIVSVSVYNGGIRLTADSGTFEAGNTFYSEIMCKGIYSSPDPSTRLKGSCNYDLAFIVGRQDLTVESIEIISGSNDIFTFDFTHNNDKKNDKREISVEIPEGVYNGSELADVLEQLIQNKFIEMGRDDLEVDVSIGGHNLGLPNTNDSTVLQITLNRASGKEPDEGQYIIDGIRGSAANSIFYKSTTTPTMTYIVGTKNIQEGISFEPGENVLTLSANSVPYKYTFDKPYYTADEFIDALNSMFENGDNNGNPAPLRASIDKSGALKISYTVAGANTITDIGGSARGTIFFEEEGRDSRDPLLIHVGSEAHQYTEIPRISVSSTALAINSITISKQKYAEKANVRIKEAINLLSSKRSTYGAIQNRLEHTINSNNNVTDSMQASESRIRDTDLSTEMIRYTNLGILLRMGSTMIAESNKRIEKLMTILQ